MSAIGGGEDLFNGCTVVGCNDPGFHLSPVTLFTASARLLTGTLVNEFVINSATPYQYYRFNTVGAGGCVSDLDLYGAWAPAVIFRPADITLNPCTGNYDLPTRLTLSVPTLSASIYYTIDGSTPTTASPRYSGPFVVNSSCTLQAMAVSAGQNANGRILSRPVHIGNTQLPALGHERAHLL